MKIIMIRHGATIGNMEGRYVGCTDEGITQEAILQLKEMYEKNKSCLEGVHALFVSPMIRCRETATILFPDKKQVVIRDFRECDFGKFEYRNYKELSGNPDYQAYIDSNGECGFPGGETKLEFQKRCMYGFSQMLDILLRGKNKNVDFQRIAMVVHGGTIMSLLDAFSTPHRDYFDWKVSNGSGYIADWKYIDGNSHLENICLL